MKQTKCGCCAVNHVHPETGAKILCDRHVVEACVRSWFGKISSFEKYVRSTFDVNLRQQLGIQYAFPYSWALCALSPVLWAEMDVIAAVSHTGSYERITARLLLGFFRHVFGNIPFHDCLRLQVCYFVQEKMYQLHIRPSSVFGWCLRHDATNSRRACPT